MNHKDGNTRNNAASNLEWVTAAQNISHAYEMGLVNPMATAIPCKYCGDFTKSKEGMCGGCRSKLAAEAAEIDRRAVQRDRYAGLDLSKLTPTEGVYAKRAADGLSVTEIAEEFRVSRQCVSAALQYALQKSARGQKCTAAQKNMRVSLVNKSDRARQKLEQAQAVVRAAKVVADASEQALLLFEQSLCASPEIY